MKLYLIPCNLSDSSLNEVIPSYVLEDVIPTLKIFMVENLRTARRFIKKVNRDINIDELTFCEIGKNSDELAVVSFFQKHIEHSDIGVLSEAGCPGVADPGSMVVDLAHSTEKAEVVPLVGPSSLLLALMGSGFNGQSFVFHGYIPVQKGDRAKRIKQLEQNARKWNQTQMFIETPFRNNQMLEAILSNCMAETKLCIATNLTADDACITTKTIKKWSKTKIDLHKKPTVFLLL